MNSNKINLEEYLWILLNDTINAKEYLTATWQNKTNITSEIIPVEHLIILKNLKALDEFIKEVNRQQVDISWRMIQMKRARNMKFLKFIEIIFRWNDTNMGPLYWARISMQLTREEWDTISKDVTKEWGKHNDFKEQLRQIEYKLIKN